MGARTIDGEYFFLDAKKRVHFNGKIILLKGKGGEEGDGAAWTLNRTERRSSYSVSCDDIRDAENETCKENISVTYEGEESEKMLFCPPCP